MVTEFFGASTLEAILLTLKLAFITSSLLLLIALPLAWFLANWQSKAKPLVMSILALPLQSLTGSNLVFSFEGLVLGSVIYSLPFALQPLYSGFSQLDNRYLDVAKTLGFSAAEAFMKIVLPLSKAPIVVALGLSFAHTIGEFGVVLMIGGNIPGETQVLSIALYEQVEALEYKSAHNLSLALLVFSFVMLAALYRFNGVTRSDEER